MKTLRHLIWSIKSDPHAVAVLLTCLGMLILMLGVAFVASVQR